MMRFLLGFASGVAAAWAALAIWQRVPPLGPVDAADEDVWEPRRGDRRPGFDDSVALERPDVSGVFRDVRGGFGSP
jgi:hypothetical protein